MVRNISKVKIIVVLDFCKVVESTGRRTSYHVVSLHVDDLSKVCCDFFTESMSKGADILHHLPWLVNHLTVIPHQFLTPSTKLVNRTNIFQHLLD